MRFPLVAFLVVLACAGCVKPQPKGEIVLHYYLHGAGITADAERRVVDAFERENPGIKVEITPVIGNYEEKMQALIVGGIFPDIMTVDINSYYEWADRGLLMDVTGDMRQAAAEAKMTFMPIVDEQLPYKGRSYAVPYGMCGVIPQVNLDAFKKAGLTLPPPEKFTWQWMAEATPKLSRRAGDPGAPVEIIGSLPDMMSLLFTFGGRVFDDPYHPGKSRVSGPEAEAMCRYVRGLLATGGWLSRAQITTSSNSGTEWEMYLRGQTAWLIHGIWQTPTAWHQKADLNWDVMPFPRGPTGLGITTNGAQLVGGSSKTKHPEAVRRFLRYYISPPAIRMFVQTGAFMPIYREMLGEPGSTSPDWPRTVRYYFDTMEDGRSLLPVYGPGVGELRRILDSRLSQAATDTTTPIPVVLKALDEEIDRWLVNQKKKGFYR